MLDKVYNGDMEPILKKVVIELRYRPVLDFLEIARSYLQPIVSHYDKYDIDDVKMRYRFGSQERSSELFVERVRSGIAIENDPDLSVFGVEANRLIDILSKAGISKTYRIGVRTFIINPLTGIEFKTSVENYSDYLLNPKNTAIERNSFTDFAVTYVGQDGDESIRVSTGIVRRLEISDKISPVLGTNENDPDVSILHDVDRYIHKNVAVPPIRTLRKMVESNLELVTKHLGNYDLPDIE